MLTPAGFVGIAPQSGVIKLVSQSVCIEVWNIRQPYEDALDTAASLTIGGGRANTTDV